MKSESKVIQNLLSMNSLTVHDIMTPRTVVVMANEDQTLNEFFNKHKKLVHSRIPLYRSPVFF